MKMNCPKCHRDTYSKKWGTCSACGGDAAAVLRNQTPTVTEPSVTEPLDTVTEPATSSTVPISPEEMAEELEAGRMSYTHGGVREGSGRKRQHKTNACRQRAYRERAK